MYKLLVVRDRRLAEKAKHPLHVWIFSFSANYLNATAQLLLNTYVTSMRTVCLSTEGQTTLAKSLFRRQYRH